MTQDWQKKKDEEEAVKTIWKTNKLNDLLSLVEKEIIRPGSIDSDHHLHVHISSRNSVTWSVAKNNAKFKSGHMTSHVTSNSFDSAQLFRPCFNPPTAAQSKPKNYHDISHSSMDVPVMHNHWPIEQAHTYIN